MHTILTKIAGVLAAPVFFLASLFNPAPAQAPQYTPTTLSEPSQYVVGAALPQTTGLFETSLATAISDSATSMSLTSNSVRGGGSISGYSCFTLDEGTAQAEVICGTVSSTSVTSLTRGVSYADGVTSVTANKFAHRRGTNVKITDFPILQILKAQNNGDVTYENPLKYAPGIGPISGSDIADKEYVLSVVSGGTISFNQVIVAGKAGETLSTGNLVYLKSSDGLWWKADADLVATIEGVQLGIAQSAGTAGNTITGGVLIRGVDTNNTGTAGSLVYASNTAGALSTSTGTTERVVGQYIVSSGGLYFDPSFYYTLSASQKAAMAGGGSFGTPSSINKFLTELARPAVDTQTFSGGGIFTVSIASPGIFTLANHGFSIGTPVVFSTTGALPTGLTAGTTYYVVSAGFTTSTFEVSTTLGGSAINTTGSQSGVHTAGFIWTKPSLAKIIQVIAVGAGGGGAGGGGGSTGPGAGGGGGAAVVQTFNASDIGSSETVFAGISGSGGSANTVGGNGTASTFGSRIIAGGGGGGATAQGSGGGGGTMVASASGATGATPTVAANAIGAQSATGTNGTGRSSEWGGASGSGGGATAPAGGSSLFAGGGGGAGGGIGGGGTASAGGTVGTYSIGGGGTAGGGAGASNTTLKKGYGGAGGGGGQGNTGGGTGTVGGAGGFPGGGGGGGGDSSATGGAGGTGGAGQVTIISYF